MKNKKMLSLGLAVAMLASSLAVPVNVNAGTAETEGDALEEDYLDYDPDCPEYKDDGAGKDYVVYVDKTVSESALLTTDSDDIDVIYENDAECICTADLTAEMAEEINEADVGMHAEPNFMFEAMADNEEPPLIDDEDARTIESEMRRVALYDEWTTAENSKDLGQSWNIRMVHGNQDSETEHHTVVAVLDSGVDFLIDAPVTKSVNLVTEEQDITYYMSDMTGHGSAMADVISRMDPNALIYSVRVLDSDNQAPLSRIIQGIRWCMEHGVDVVNMSFGAFQESQALKQMIEEASAQGIVFVAAAGNSGNRGVAYPAAYEEVLSVGAVDAQAEKTPESAVGENVDLVAPGESVDVQSMLGLYTCVDGTSIAAAHVAGAASVLAAQETEKDAELVSGLLKESANFISSESGYGNGLLDLSYALENYDTYEQMCDVAAGEGEGEAPVSLEENDAALPIFSEEEVQAEALWKEGGDAEDAKRGHRFLAITGVNYANANLTSISATAAEAYKKGAVAPDNYSMSRLHGEIESNYITSYRLVTQIATKDGDTSTITHGVKGQPQTAYEGIIEQFSLQGIVQGKKVRKNNPLPIKNVSWAEVIGSDYTGSDARKAKLRRIFIYGMALHAITDTFAHDAYVWYNNKMQRIEHESGQGSDVLEADSANQYPNRFEDAKKAARKVIMAYNDTAIGGLTDFAPVDTQNSRGYYLGELLTCAKKAKYAGFTDEYLASIFGNLTYDGTGVTVH